MFLKVFLYIGIWFGSYTNGWEVLSDLRLEQEYDDLIGEMIEMPVFSDKLKSYEGKEITVEGYVIPLQHTAGQDYFVLSRFPYNNCFFCGNAGPETVAEVYTNKKFEYRDAKVRVKGQLELNADDPLHLFFIINDAEVEVMD